MKLSLRRAILFSLFGTLMFVSDLVMEALPNVHLIAFFILTLTRVYRTKAVIPLYIYVCLTGLFYGFSTWWIPYLYIWAVLWALALLLPKKLSKAAEWILYPLLGALFGLSFGTLYAPAQALLYGFTFRQMLLWIASGLTFDVIHALSNLATCLLVVPCVRLLEKLEAKSGH